VDRRAQVELKWERVKAPAVGYCSSCWFGSQRAEPHTASPDCLKVVYTLAASSSLAWPTVECTTHTLPASSFLATRPLFSSTNLAVCSYQRTRTHSPHPTPWPDTGSRRCIFRVVELEWFPGRGGASRAATALPERLHVLQHRLQVLQLHARLTSLHATAAYKQGLTLVHFSAQLEPCRTHTQHPTHPNHSLNTVYTTPTQTPYPMKSTQVEPNSERV